MADIKHYQIIRELYNGEHVNVYFVKNKENGETGILRLMNGSENHEDWKKLYRHYGIHITKNKSLPSLKWNDVWEDRPFVVLDGAEGNLLEIGQVLTGRQIDLLLEAVIHLHQQNILFGKLTRFNIWIKVTGDLALYGAGERTIFYPERKMSIEDDVKQVLAFIKNYSEIPDHHFDGLSFETASQLQEWVLAQLAIPKPGLVDMGETSKTVFAEPEPKTAEVPRIEKRAFPSSPTSPKVKQKKGSLVKWLGGAVMAALLGFIAIGMMQGDAEQTGKEEKQQQLPTEVKSENTNGAVQEQVPANNTADLSKAAPLFSGWEFIKQVSTKLGNTEYTIVAASQKRDEYSGVVKIAVLSVTPKGEWQKLWESPEYESYLSEQEYYVQSFLTVASKDAQKALLVFDLPDGGSMGISEVKAITIQVNGNAEEVWSGYGFSLNQENDAIVVKEMGVKKLSIADGKFTLEEFARSESAPADAKTVMFDLNESGMVIPVNDKLVSLKSGDKLAFIPSNPEVKRKFDQGEITIYTDIYTGGDGVSLANAFIVKSGNYVQVDEPGEFHFVLEYLNGPELDFDRPEPTFIAEVGK